MDEDAVDPLAQQCTELLEQTGEVWDAKQIREKFESRSDPDPLKTVLYQEVDRYNNLLGIIRRTLSTIIKITQGNASVTAELEEVMISLGQLKVPRIWGSTYPSLKPLGLWMRDLAQRVEFFNNWIVDALPACWWLPAMTYPSGFLTAVLQVSARANGVSIDTLSYETPVLTTADSTSIIAAPKDGVYCSGIFVEGATWNFPGGFLEESRPMELISIMPIMHFKPVESKRKTLKVTHSLTHWLTHSLTGLLTHSLTHWLTYSLTHLLGILHVSVVHVPGPLGDQREAVVCHLGRDTSRQV